MAKEKQGGAKTPAKPKVQEVVLSCVYGDKQPNDTIKLPPNEAKDLIERGWAVQK